MELDEAYMYILKAKELFNDGIEKLRIANMFVRGATERMRKEADTLPIGGAEKEAGKWA